MIAAANGIFLDKHHHKKAEHKKEIEHKPEEKAPQKTEQKTEKKSEQKTQAEIEASWDDCLYYMSQLDNVCKKRSD